MPTYLIHGFRWSRLNIRILVILNDIEEAASEWIMAPATSIALLEYFTEKFDFIPSSSPPQSPTSPLNLHVVTTPVDTTADASHKPRVPRAKNSRASLRSLVRKSKPTTQKSSNEQLVKHSADAGCQPPPNTTLIGVKTSPHFNDWSPVKLVEQYDPHEMYMCTQPYAYVADYLVNVELSLNIMEEMRKYDSLRGDESQNQEEEHNPPAHETKMDGETFERCLPQNKYWLERLRDELEKDGEIGWYIVYCGDQEREIPPKASSHESIVEVSHKTQWSLGLKSFFLRNKRNE